MFKTPIYMVDDETSTRLHEIPKNAVIFIKEPRPLLITLVDKKNVTELTTMSELLDDDTAYMVVSDLIHTYDEPSKTMTVHVQGVPS